jgi:NAD(P)H dehydrogenase (quinone)
MSLLQKPLVFLVGATGQTGTLILEDLDRYKDEVHVRIGVRSSSDLMRFKSEGRDAVHFDLDDARTFGAALAGVDRLYLLTGYTIAMVHQSKTLVDAARKAGICHIVNQGVFSEWDCTDPHFVWFGLVERYIEDSGIAWTHLHPNVFMEYLLASSPPRAGRFSVFWGKERVGWVALQDVAEVASKVLRDGSAKHGQKDYWMSTEALDGDDVASVLSEVLATPISCDARLPGEFEALFTSGSLKIESWYAKGAVEFCVQVVDGRMGYIGNVRDDIPHLLGRPARTLRQWSVENKEALLKFVREV